MINLENALQRLAFEKTRDAIVSVSPEMELQNANPTALHTFPVLKNFKPGEKLTGDALEDVERLLSGKVFEYKFENQTFECNIHEIKNGDVLVSKVIWLSDITDRVDFLNYAKEYQIQLKEQIKEKAASIVNIQKHIMMNMADVIEARDGNTGGHVKRTSEIVRILVNAMQKDNFPGITALFVDDVARLAPLHDMGKIGISDLILNKPGKLTDEEFEIMKSHAAKGKAVVDLILEGTDVSADTVRTCENIAQFHHEKWDGTGYPNKLKGEEIPLESRIMAIADVYDALVSKRVYKPPMPFDVANKIMMESFGKNFDPNLQKYYEICRPTIESFYEKDREA